MTLRIEVFAVKEGNLDWVLMEETSQYLTARQLVPSIGDTITIAGKDAMKIDIGPDSFKHIQTVKRKWLNYATSDVALLLHYAPF